MKPVIAIVGRPNVGKSTLLNFMAKRRVALVADTPGVTRDRLFVDTQLGDHPVLLVDTGGFDPAPDDDLTRSTVLQTHIAIEEADLVLFMCDAKDGLHPIDQTIANLLRKSQKPFLCLVNKVDPGAHSRDPYEFHQLGLDLITISASHGSGIDQLAQRVNELLGPAASEEDEASDCDLKICLLGRPNVGKSSLANYLTSADRQIVSPTPGTTRDAVNIPFQQGTTRCLLVDTPGVRRRSRIDEQLEHYSVMAALRSLERCDVAVAVLDSSIDFAVQDARLLRLAHDRGKGLIVAVNKCDLLSPGQEQKELFARLEHELRFVPYAPVLAMSAETGRGVDKIVPEAVKIAQNLSLRITTGDLNRFIAEATEQLTPPMVRGRRAKIFYITQAEIRPPTFVASVNDPDRLPNHYRKYLENRLRKIFPFRGVPLRWFFRSRATKEGRKGKRKQ